MKLIPLLIGLTLLAGCHTRTMTRVVNPHPELIVTLEGHGTLDYDYIRIEDLGKTIWIPTKEVEEVLYRSRDGQILCNPVQKP